MALVRFNDGTPEKKLDAETAREIWLVLNGEKEGTPQQDDFCTRIDAIYLNYRNAPDSYIAKRLDTIAPMVMSHWMVNHSGYPTRPEPSDSFGRAFAKRWGLMEHGKLTDKGHMYANLV